MRPIKMDYDDFKNEIIQELEKSRFGVLATTKGDFVTARSIMLICDGLKISFFTTSWSRKYKQILVNKNVALAINRIQIEGEAIIKGRTSDLENAGFLKAFEKLHPELYLAYRDYCKEPDTVYQVIDVIPKRRALFHGSPETQISHFDVLNTEEKTAIRHSIKLGEDYSLNY